MDRRDYVIGWDAPDFKSRNVGDQHPMDRFAKDTRRVTVLEGTDGEIADVVRGLKVASAALRFLAVTRGNSEDQADYFNRLAVQIDTPNVVTEGLPPSYGPIPQQA